MAVVMQEFEEEILSQIAEQGLDSGLAMVVFPDELAQTGSDLSIIADRIQEIIDGLTEFEP